MYSVLCRQKKFERWHNRKKRLDEAREPKFSNQTLKELSSIVKLIAPFYHFRLWNSGPTYQSDAAYLNIYNSHQNGLHGWPSNGGFAEMCHFIARCVAIQYQVLQFSRHLRFVALRKFQTKLLNIKQQTVTLSCATIHGPKETSTVNFFLQRGR